MRNKILVTALTLALWAPFALGASVRRMSFDALIKNSDNVVYGRAIENRSFWDATTGRIWTQTEILVLDGPKGRTGRTISVSEPGGILGTIGHVFPGVPKFEPDREVVLFLRSMPSGRVRVVGLEQGVFDVTHDQSTGERIVQSRVVADEIEETATAPRLRKADVPRRLGDFLNLIRERASAR